MHGEAPLITNTSLFSLLAEGHTARVTVVTPNRRLAAALARDFDGERAAAGCRTWEAPDILPLAAFIQRLYEDALYSELAAAMPQLLLPVQQQALWEKVIAATQSGRELLSLAPAASLAADAWELAHAWRLATRPGDAPANDEAKAFADWSRRYERETQRARYTDGPRLAPLLEPHLGHRALRKARTLVVYGFDIVTPQAQRFFAVLGEAGTAVVRCGPAGRASRNCRVAFPSARHELQAAARWARARLESAAACGRMPRIGIVVPDLGRSRKAVQRILANVMAPGRALERGTGRPVPFNLSLGEPLAEHPLVVAALAALDLSAGEVDFASASRLLRSPFLAGAEAEMAQRARLDAGLRKKAGPKTDLARLRRAIAQLTAADQPYRAAACPVLSRRLAELAASGAGLAGSRRASEWSKAVSGLLDRLGFPGERSLDSVEYQALKAWQEVVSSFASLDLVAGEMRFAEARARLARVAASQVFQPEAPDVPIQVLGVLESAGLVFDHLWVTGLTDEAWPMPARANPLLPIALQRAAGVPEAAPETSLALDRVLTAGWLAAAEEVVFSHPLHEGDRDLAQSTLIRDVPAIAFEQLDLPRYPELRTVLRQAVSEEQLEDMRGPAMAAAHAQPVHSAGGTSVFRDQAVCPFRAFAIHRLGAEGIESPPIGLDASERGTLVHGLLACVWQELKSHARLQALAERDVEGLLANAADTALERVRRSRPGAIANRFAELERKRLIALGRAWLELEKTRPPFEVARIEEKHSVCFGGLAVNARLDRMDRLHAADGSAVHAILDYKTGRVNIGDWLGPRPDEPQIPLYAVGSGETVAASVFARVKAGEMEFKGLAREAGLIPRVQPLQARGSTAAPGSDPWEDLLSHWREELHTLGREFVAGVARVEPKRGSETCKCCELKALCRINERSRVALEDFAAEDPAVEEGDQ